MKKSDNHRGFILYSKLSPYTLIFIIVLLSIITLFFIVILFNPIRNVFIDSFYVINMSGEDVWITPIGMREGDGKFGPLFTISPKVPTNIFIKACGEVKITYNWDDINFRYILVKDYNGTVRMLKTDNIGDINHCYPAQNDTYIIPPLSKLELAPIELLPTLSGEFVEYNSNISENDKVM